MVFNSDTGDWVAFAEDDDIGDTRLDLFARSKVEPIRVAPNRPEEPQKRFIKSDVSTASSWMKKPINTDASWAPVAPPESREPVPLARTHRPPRNPTSSPRHKQAVSPAPHALVSSSDSSSDGRPGARDRAAATPPTSRRGRSSSRSRPAPAPRASSRARSSSKTRPTNHRDRSTSRTRQPTSHRDRSTSRTRPSSGHRSRSASTHRRTGSGQSQNSQSRRRSRSNSRTRATTIQPRVVQQANANRPPPSTARTRGLVKANVSGSASVGPGLPRHSNPMSSPNGTQNTFDDNASFKSFDVNIGRDISFGRTKSSRSLADQKVNGRMTNNVVVSTNRPEPIHPRILLTATVYHNTATNLWIATINTNQKGVSKNPSTASKYLKAFSFGTEKEARESAIANAPPKMLPFSENPVCFGCNAKFSMFKRPSHCRNCGVCVCSACTFSWACSSIPETYNLKKQSQVKICKSCNTMSGSFKKALLAGDYEEAIALYGSGNVNLRVPFPATSKKGEIMFPVHCAAQGGNIHILRWLLEDHFCSIKRVVKSSSSKKGGKSDLMIRTSKDRTVLSIALSSMNVEMVRYLVVDRGVSIYEAKDLQAALRSLEAALHILPPPEDTLEVQNVQTDHAVHRWDTASYNEDMSIGSSFADFSRADDATLGSRRSARGFR